VPITSARRYYLLSRQQMSLEGEPAMAGVWRAKQEAQPGAPLPAGFPEAESLARAGYTTVEDLDGACADELEDQACLSPPAAAAVLTALAALLDP
jgi:hypothetical protein